MGFGLASGVNRPRLPAGLGRREGLVGLGLVVSRLVREVRC